MESISYCYGDTACRNRYKGLVYYHRGAEHACLRWNPVTVMLGFFITSLWLLHTDIKQADSHYQIVLTDKSLVLSFLVPPDWRSDEEGSPGRGAVVSPFLAMAAPYFPTFLLLIFLSSVGLLLLTLLPSVAPSLPFASSSLSAAWPSCGPGQSWAVRIHHSQHHQEDEREASVHLDVIANRVL